MKGGNIKSSTIFFSLNWSYLSGASRPKVIPQFYFIKSSGDFTVELTLHIVIELCLIPASVQKSPPPPYPLLIQNSYLQLLFTSVLRMRKNVRYCCDKNNGERLVSKSVYTL